MRPKILNLFLFISVISLIGCISNTQQLKQKEIATTNKKTPVSLIDGPYIFEKEQGYEVFQIMKAQGTTTTLQTLTLSEDSLETHVLHSYDHNGAPLYRFKLAPFSDKTESAIYPMPERVVAISDIEGQYDAFANLLKSTGVVNHQMDWVYGKGHLVLVGDFFDRGNMVTETLWLIYKLEQEAKKVGGRVHFLLGNHEILNLQGYESYVTAKHLKNAKRMTKPYASLYNSSTVLGKWLRTKNIMVKIGQNLFVHLKIGNDYKNKF